jgi:predicted RNase H-like HicB family nuclease
MRIISKSRTHFYGTHKGHTINIEKESDGTFYIIVKDERGSYAYDGWAPNDVRTMAQAKREAIRGACL